MTSSWAIVALQCLIMLLVFALGIPVVATRLRVPREFQRLIAATFKLDWRGRAVLLLLGLSILYMSIYSCLITGEFGLVGEAVAMSSAAQGVAIILFLSSALATIHAWHHYLRFFSFENVLDRIELHLLEKFRIYGRLPDRAMENLRFIGLNARPGFETQAVLDIVERVGLCIIESEGYDGASLSSLSGSVAVAVEKSSELDLRAALVVLIRLRRRLQEFQKIGDVSEDMRAILDSGSILLSIGVSRHFEGIVLQGVEQLLFESPSRLFAVAEIAFRRHMINVCVGAMSILEARMEIGDERCRFYYYGLASAVFDSGEAGAALADSYFEGVRRDGIGSLVAASESLLSVGHLEAANCVARVVGVLGAGVDEDEETAQEIVGH